MLLSESSDDELETLNKDEKLGAIGHDVSQNLGLSQVVAINDDEGPEGAS